MKKVLISTIAATLLLGVSAGANEATKNEKSPVLHNEVKGASYYSMQKKAAREFIPTAIKAHNAAAPKAPKEVLEALTDTVRAVQAIQHKDAKSAQKYLEQADKLFAGVLKAHPELKFIPVEESIFVNDVIITPQDAKKVVDTAKDLLSNYRTQTARQLLIPFSDEMDILTSYLPMELYPVATRKALDLVKKEKLEEAVAVLAEAFNTIVTVKTVVPIPLLAAQDFVMQASKLDKSKKEEVMKLLEAAKAELQKAYYFGYTSKNSAAYKDLYDQIKGIEKEIEGKNVVEKLYTQLKESFNKVIGKIYSDMRDSVANEEAKALKNPRATFGSPAAKAQIEELQSKEEFEAKEERVGFAKEVKEDLEKAPLKK